MKLLRLGNVGKEIPAAVDKNGKFRNLSSHIKDLNPETINFETLKDLKKIDLFKYVSKDDGRIKPFNRSKNISLILHKLENELMDSCRKLMIDNNIIFISMFDSFIVKKNGSKKVMDMLNKELQTITKVVKFRIDM